MAKTELPSDIEFFFDPVCPWTWLTSRWAVDVAERKGINITWRSLSLAVLNKDNDIPEQYRAPMNASTGAHRLFAALRKAGRNDLIGDAYTEIGRRIFHDGSQATMDLMHDVAKAVDATEWDRAIDDTSWDAEIEASTSEALEIAGPDVGSPTVAFDTPRVGTFGPIVSPPPTGDDADDLLDIVVRSVRMKELFEVKRGRKEGPQFGPRP